MNRRPLLALVLLALVLGACASSRGTAHFRRDVGTASGPDALMLAEQVITRHGYRIEHADTVPEIRIQTGWRPRAPLEDERALGVTSAENRILVVGRMRGQSSDLGGLYVLNMTIENRVQVAGTPEFTETLGTDMFREYAESIVNELRDLVLNIGVRRF